MSKKITNNSISDKNFYLNILKNNPSNYEAILKLGLIDVKENNLLFAKEKFKKLLKIDKTKHEGYLNLSNIYSFEGKTLKAVERLVKKPIQEIELEIPKEELEQQLTKKKYCFNNIL